MSERLELELIEEYELLGEKRFRFRVKGTTIVLNVSAGSREEAERKALELARELGIESILSMLKRSG